jgi:hypothetical protein
MKKYLCIKDYHPIIHKKNNKVEPTDKPVTIAGDILIQMCENDTRYKSTKIPHLALYEYTLLEYNNCFKLL